MKLFPTIFLAGLAVMTASGEPTFNFGTTDDWRGERIELPPGFAPTLGWKGVETIRFAPGMFQADSESFFSYALVFLLEEGSDVSEAGLQREVLKYYQGLATAVMKGKGVEVDAEKFTLTLSAATPAAAEGESRNFTGKLDWVEPFATQKPQNLNLEVRLWKHGEQPAIFFGVSPQPANHKIWAELRRIRDAFRFEE